MKKNFWHPKNLFNDLIHVIYPDLCIGCHTQPKTNQGIFCVECLFAMPYTDHFQLRNNDLTDRFKGRIKLEHGAALLRFREGGIVQDMLHGLKYKGQKETGYILGELAGKKMFESPLFDIPDVIVPVPIHPRKKSRRGYNQSAIFGHGISQTTGIKLAEDAIIKDTETVSQTGLSKFDRLMNVSETFIVNQVSVIKGRHVLLVDDVVTSGATIEACCLKMQDQGVSKISILTIAATTH